MDTTKTAMALLGRGALSAACAWLVLYGFGSLTAAPLLPLGVGLASMVVCLDMARDRDYPTSFRAYLYGGAAGCFYAAAGALVPLLLTR